MRNLIFKMMLIFATSANLWAAGGGEALENAPGYICEGTQWTFESLVMTGPFEFEVAITSEWIEGTEEINGKTYMKVWSNWWNDHSRCNVIGYIRIEGEKIYCVKDLSEDSQEMLMFDYSIEEGEIVNFPPVVNGEIPFNLEGATLKCIETGVEAGENEDFPSLTVEYFDEGESLQSVVRPIKWIKGIGGEAGVLNNFASGKSGLYSVSEVYHDGILVYKAQNGGAGVESVADDDVKRGLAGRRYHIDGREFKDGDTGVCIENGRKTIR